MDTVDLPDAEQETIKQLVETRRKYPEADFFETTREGATVMPGARHDVRLSFDREVLRRLGHLKLIAYSRDVLDGFGHGRHVFDVTPRAADFV